MSDSSTQICPVCGVKIQKMIGSDRVVFAHGPAGTRAKLWARVCKFVDNSQCINQDEKAIGAVTTTDYYKPLA
ncbi:hypothetical protein [Chroococcus sp. FPU101]|uniref:hypothetical protein n=1 Tax=Chroococcus sp. FPU101 TaxID=1974212 RepID=UPI001A90395E|nr:hypothetical protein [Chroococcus sp. FPU101]GFE67624.1 hypothetical protein CFPU101_02340 [Chroococcus sp. FPU101]